MRPRPTRWESSPLCSRTRPPARVWLGILPRPTSSDDPKVRSSSRRSSFPAADREKTECRPSIAPAGQHIQLHAVFPQRPTRHAARSSCSQARPACLLWPSSMPQICVGLIFVEMTLVIFFCLRAVMVGVIVFFDELIASYSALRRAFLMFPEFVFRFVPHDPGITELDLRARWTPNDAVAFLLGILHGILPNFIAHAFAEPGPVIGLSIERSLKCGDLRLIFLKLTYRYLSLLPELLQLVVGCSLFPGLRD